jgi:hypothetical protein
MIATLGLAWGLDHWLDTFRRQAQTEMNIPPLIWSIVAVNLLIAAAWALLAWWTLFRTPRDRIVGVTYLLVGLILTVLVPIQITVPDSIRGFTLFDATRFFRAAYLAPGITTRFALTAAFIFCLGVLNLLLPRSKDR